MPRLYGSIPHLPGSRAAEDRVLPPSDARRCLDPSHGNDRETVVVQEKLDGSCVALVRGEGGRLEARGREGRLASESPNEGRRRFARWVLANEDRLAPLVGPGEILVGEWLALVHGTRYALPHEPFVVLDLLRPASRAAPAMRVRAPAAELAARLAGSGLPVPATIHRGAPLPVAEAAALLGPHGRHGAIDPPEGLVYRVERACPDGPRVVLVAKWVRPGKVDGAYLPENTGGAALYHDDPR